MYTLTRNCVYICIPLSRPWMHQAAPKSLQGKAKSRHDSGLLSMRSPLDPKPETLTPKPLNPKPLP